MTQPAKAPKDLIGIYESLKKNFGQNAVMFASEIPAYQVVSSGSLVLDYTVGIGGFPTNRVIEIGGQEGTGKTTTCLHTINNFLKHNPDRGALYIDIENRLTPDWVASFVEDHDRVIVVKPDTIEEATDIYVEAVKTGLVQIAVLDSVGGAPTQRVMNKSATIGNVGGNALGVTRFSQFASAFSGKYNCCTIGINQERDDTDGYNRYITPGGRAWRHACSLRLRLKRPSDGKVTAFYEGKQETVGWQVSFHVVKNSLGGLEGRSSYYYFYPVETQWGFGIDTLEEIHRLSTLVGVIEKRAGGWYYHPGLPEGKIRGESKLAEYLSTHPEFSSHVVQETLDSLSKTDRDLVSTFVEEGTFEAQVEAVKTGRVVTTVSEEEKQS